MMHPAVANFLRKLKASGTVDYIWEMSLQGPSPGQGNLDGVAGRILGFPVYLNESMSSTFATNNRLVIFGDLKSYWIQDGGGPVLKRAEELRLFTNETVFVAFRRSDGNLINTQAVRHLRTA